MPLSARRVGQRINGALRDAGVSVEQVAAEVGRSPGTVRNWLYGARVPDLDSLAVIAGLTNKPIGYFTGEEGAEVAEAVRRLEALLGAGAAQTIEGGLIAVPVFERVAAGTGGVADSTPTEYRHIPRTWIPTGQEASCFLVRATGDSMVDVGIAEGDELLICTAVRVRDGDIAIVDLGDEVVVKRVYRRNDSLLLISEHSGVPPREVSEARIVGRVMRSSRTY